MTKTQHFARRAGWAAAVLALALPCFASMALAAPEDVAPVPAAAAGAASAASCQALAKLKLPGASIGLARMVAAGEYLLPKSGFGNNPGMNLAGRAELGPNPAFCRVAVILKPTADSNIAVEVWLPRSNWNGKLLTAGNFGSAGSLMYAGMLTALEAGYATTSTDTGHDNAKPDESGLKFALGHPQKLIDYAYRADHLMTVAAKAVVKALYGKAPAHTYWIGCSLGGLEGLIEARRYPADYDGIVAGAPPNPLARFNAFQMYPDWLIQQDPARLIPKEKYEMVHQAVLQACASPIGQKDGFVEEPDKCGFDPAQLQCKATDGPDCLTAPQVFLLQQFYAGPTNPRTHELIFPGQARGSEGDMFMFANGQPLGVATELYRYAVFQDPNWDWKTIDWDRDVDRAQAKIGPLMDVDSDLKPFFDHGGKLLLYIGWNDGHNPEQLIEYYKTLMADAGPRARDDSRLFTIPGMGHCGGGAGCDTFDKIAVIDQWVDEGKAPERIVAGKFDNGNLIRTRPLCAYPLVARYQGTGDPDAAANFICASTNTTTAQSVSAGGAETGLLQAELDRVSAMVQPDVVHLNQGLADELVFVHGNGSVQGKTQFLQSFNNSRAHFRSIELSERTARIYGDVGVTHGLQTVHLDTEVTLSDRYTGVYVKRDGRWQLVGWQSTALHEPDKKSPNDR